jgi:hypothetical protein
MSLTRRGDVRVWEDSTRFRIMQLLISFRPYACGKVREFLLDRVTVSVTRNEPSHICVRLFADAIQSVARSCLEHDTGRTVTKSCSTKILKSLTD